MRFVDEGRTLSFSVSEHAFCKRRIKEIEIFAKICKKFVIMKNRQDARIFLSFNIVVCNIQ